MKWLRERDRDTEGERQTSVCLISIKAHRFRMRQGSEREVDRPCNSEEET